MGGFARVVAPICDRSLAKRVIACPAVPTAGVISTLAIIHYCYLAGLPHERLVGFIADDAFYELQIARHFLATGIWSFDGGFTTTTGFHLLNVYTMALFPRLLAHPWLAIKFWMAIGVALSIVSIFTICLFASRTFGAFSLVPAFLVLTASTFTLQSAGLLEFPYVVAIAALYVTALFRSCGTARPPTLLGIFGLGALGSLARSDFGGMPFALFAACAIGFLVNRRSDYLVRSLCGLAGATVGLAVVLFHNFLFSGHFLQGSAMAKALWGSRAGYHLYPPAHLVMGTLISLQDRYSATPEDSYSATIVLMFGAVVLIRTAAAAVSRWRGAPPQTDVVPTNRNEDRLLAGGGLGAIALYVLLYGADPVLQPWYSANFVTPLVLVLGAASRVAGRDRVLRACTAIVVAILVILNVAFSYAALWPRQGCMLEMADHLQSQPVDGRTGAWNAGIVGFFLDGKVVNLDGLMNDQIYPYIRAATVAQYIDDAKIKYIVDFRRVIEDVPRARLRGYDALALGAHLKPLYTVVSEDRTDYYVDYTLFENEDVAEQRGN